MLNFLMFTLQTKFAMKDLGTSLFFFFLGVEVTTTAYGLRLTQQKYAQQLFERHDMFSSKSVSTSISSMTQLSSHESLLKDLHTYHQIVGALQYLTFTRPYISYAVNLVALFLQGPRDPHLQVVKRILRYIRGTMNYAFYFSRCTSPYLVGYSDADWVGCPDIERSTSGFCVFLGSNLISWFAEKQSTISRSSSEAEYHSVLFTLAESVWIYRLLQDLGVSLCHPLTIYYSNLSTTYIAVNPILQPIRYCMHGQRK